MKSIRTLAAITLLGLAISPGWTAQTVPTLINYQGLLVNPDNSPIADGNYEVHFRVYDAATGGTLIWGPQTMTVTVYNGQFNAALGPTDIDVDPITDAFGAPDRYLEIQVETNSPIAPRQRILSAPFALNAAQLNGVGWDAVFDNGDPATGYIPGDKLAASSVTSAQIGTDTITTANIAPTAITSALIPDGTVQQVDLGPIYQLSAPDGDPPAAVYVDAEGRVGVGTVSPTYPLTVDGDLTVLTGNSIKTLGTGTGVIAIGYYYNPQTVISGGDILMYTTTGTGPGKIKFHSTVRGDLNPTTLYRLSQAGVDHLRIDGAYLSVPRVYMTATSTGTGTYLVRDSNNQVVRYTSSKRYKENIHPMQDDFSKILELSPKRYTRKDNPQGWEVGYIAEDLDKIGLQPLTIYDAEGRPEAIDYMKMSVYSNEILKEHRDQLKTQQEEIRQLKAELNDLKALLRQGIAAPVVP